MESSESSLRVLRLKTGEDIIAELTVLHNRKTERKTYSVSNPLRLIYMMGNNGTSITVGMIEWIFPRVSEDTSFNLKEEDVLLEMFPTKAIQKYYWDYLNNPSEVEEPVEDSNASMNLLNSLPIKKGKLN